MVKYVKIYVIIVKEKYKFTKHKVNKRLTQYEQNIKMIHKMLKTLY